MTLKKDSILSGIALLVIGILFIAAPATSAKVIAAIIGIVLILEGLFRRWVALRQRVKNVSQKLLAILALVLIVLGIFLLINPGYLIAYSYVIFGIVLILNALYNIYGVLRGEIRVAGNRLFYLILSAALAVIGIVILFNPFTAANVMMRIIGGLLMAGGIVNRLIAWKMRD